MSTAHKKLLIVDDEAGIRDSLRLLLKNHFEVITAENGSIGVQKATDDKPDIILLDLHMPELDGLATLKALKSKGCECPVIMLTAAGSVESAVEAMKEGAKDFLTKPFDIEALTNLMLDLLMEAGKPQPKVHAKQENALPTGGPVSLVGQSTMMQTLRDRITQVARKDATVLITGESGTGKEVVARSIHEASKRVGKPFVAINCAAIPESLIESELFGHEKGSFTGAIEAKLGQCEVANGGTLFLDEIGELSLSIQVKLLRFLQEQEFYRVGSSKPTKVDVRIICATNRNLEEMVEAKTFRQDLFYRINVIDIEVPPLRDRFEDIIGLCDHFVLRFGSRYDNRKLEFTSEAQSALTQYNWPGNVRELENVIESLLALAPDDLVDATVLPKKVLQPSGGLSIDLPGGNVFEGSLKFGDAEKRFESEMIIKALKRTNYVQTKAAELLGISRRILKYKMDKLGIPASADSAS